MPGAIDGSSILLFVQTTPGNYVAVGSQSNLQVNRKMTALDVSDKSTRMTSSTSAASAIPIWRRSTHSMLQGDLGQTLLKSGDADQDLLRRCCRAKSRAARRGSPLEHANCLVTAASMRVSKKSSPGTWKVYAQGQQRMAAGRRRLVKAQLSSGGSHEHSQSQRQGHARRREGTGRLQLSHPRR